MSAKINNRDLARERITQAPQRFTVGEITKGDSALKQAANFILAGLKEIGHVTREGTKKYGVWVKAEAFGGEVAKKPRVPVSRETRDKLKVVRKAPRNRAATKTVAILTLLKEAPGKFTIQDILKGDPSLRQNTVREIIRLLGNLGEVRSPGPGAGGMWVKSDTFGTGELWGLLEGKMVKVAKLRDNL